MNLFCFTLAGSTESIYEAAYSQSLKEVRPKCHCSPALPRCHPEWGGSDPSIGSNQPENAMKSKRGNKRSCLPTSPSDNDTLERDISHVCWMSSGDQKDLSHQNKVQSRAMCEAPCQSSRPTRHDGVKEPNRDRTRTDPPAQLIVKAGTSQPDSKDKREQVLMQTLYGNQQASETAAEFIHTKRRLKKLQSLVQAKKGHQSGAGKRKNPESENNDGLSGVGSSSNAVLTCIGLGKGTEKSSSPRQQKVKDHDDSEEEGVLNPRGGHHLWSPFECPQPWSPFYHTCHQPQHERRVCGGTLSLPRTTEWDRFESLIQELDIKPPSPSPSQMLRSTTDLHLSPDTLTRYGRLDAFSQHMPSMKPTNDVSCAEQTDDPSKSGPKEIQMEASESVRTPAEALPERVQTATAEGDTQKNKVPKEAAGGRPTNGHRRSTNSLESLYSLKSGQSSSSGVTSGSDCSSNRGSLKLEEDLPYTRQFCGRARVHTDHVPSPYDTESLQLKVGDVIDIIAKPPMGTWTGMLNGRIGNFKFIYVDSLREKRPEIPRETQTHKVKRGSTVQEVLKTLRLEEYSSPLQQNGHQAVEDLMRLREHHLTELNVTDAEHRRRLLGTADSLQRLRSDRQLKNEGDQEADTSGENTKADVNSCSRDSGCPDNTAEDTDFTATSQQPLTAETTVSSE